LPQLLWFAPVFLWVSVALGRRVLLWLGVGTSTSRAERFIMASALGTGVLQFIPFALGAAGVLKPRPLRIALALLAIGLAWDLSMVARRAAEWVRTLSWRPTWITAWAAVIAPGLLAILLLAIAPTFDDDGMIYHLTTPKRWLTTGSLSYLTTYPYTNAPMGVQSIFAIALTLVGDFGAKVLNLQAAVLAGAAAFLAGSRLHGRGAGAAAATAMFAMYAIPAGQLGSAYIEGMMMFAMTSAVLAWLIWVQEKDMAVLRCAGLLAGFAVSFKITCAGVALVLVALSVFALWDSTRRAGRPWKEAALAALPALTMVPLLALPVIPWMVRAGLLTGNPFFPALATHISTRDFTPASAEIFARAMRYRNWGSKFDAWSMERRELLVLAVALSLTVGVLLLATRIRSRVGRAAALAVLAVLLLQLSAMGLNARLCLPLAGVLTIPAVALVGRVFSRNGARTALIAFAAIASAMHLRKVNHEAGLIRLTRVIGSEESRRAFALDVLPPLALTELANQTLPADARILLSHYAPGFYLNQTTFSSDFIQDALHFTTWDQFLTDVRTLGVTHVIVRKRCDPCRDSLVDREREFTLVHRLLQEHGRYLGQAEGVELHAVSLASVGSPASP
jgi:hypothetical protein